MAQYTLTDEDIDKIEKGSTGSRKSTAEATELALSHMWWRPDKEIGVPKRAIKKCLLEGIQKAGIKFGRGSLVPYAKATVFVEEEMPSLGLKQPDFIERFALQRKDGSQVVIRRGGVREGWKLRFTFLVVDARRDPDQLKKAMDEAGVLVGLGAGRPDYGRFEVTRWNVMK